MALCLFSISSHYFLLPDGNLKKMQVFFYVYLGIYIIGKLILRLYPFPGNLWYVFSPFSLWESLLSVPLIIVALGYLKLLNSRYRLQRKNKERYTINQSFNIMGMRLSQNLTIQWIDKLCETMLEYSSQELQGMPLATIFHDDSNNILSQISQYAKSQETHDCPQTFSIKFIRKNGSTGWGQLVMSKEFHGEAAFSFKAGISDISNAVQEKFLLESFQLALDSVKNIGLTISSISTKKIIYTNKFDAEMHGYKVEEVIGKPVFIYAPLFLKESSFFDYSQSSVIITLNTTKSGTVFPVRLFTTYNIALDKKITFCERLTQIFPYGKIDLHDYKICLMSLDFNYTLQWVNTNVSRILNLDKTQLRLKQVFRQDSYQKLLETLPNEFPQKFMLTKQGDLQEEIPVYLATFKGLDRYFLIGSFEDENNRKD
jgi:PAS domain S-box-containing protein